jgi:flagellar biosynthetic protein FlhB
MTLIAFGGHFLQIGPMFTPSRLVPDFSRVDPVSGLARMRERAGVGRWFMGLFKLAAVLCVAGFSLWNRREQLVGLVAFDLPHMATSAWQILLTLGWQAGGTLAGLAAVDYLFERWRLERALRMTPQELREEMREMRGDPQVAARRAAMRVGP